MYKKKTLGNGLRIIMNRMPKMKSVSLGIWIKAGGRYEDAGNKGISHYLEHLLFKGTKKYSYRRLKELIEGKGGNLNGFTSEEVTCYLVKLPYRYLDLGLDILSDMVINPLLPEVEVQKERTVILEELKMYRDLPQSYVYELLDELLWPQHALGMSIIGSVESINTITRQDLYSYKNKYYTPLNIVVSIAGLFEPDNFTKRVATLFSHSKDQNINTFLEAKEAQGKPQFNFLHKDTEQTHLALGFHAYKRGHPLKYAQALLHVVLGANMSSRLFNVVREELGLAYEIGTQVKPFADTGAFLVHAGIDNRKVNQAISVILKELRNIKENLITEDEFKRAKEFYLGQLELALEDTMDNMLWIGDSVVTMDKAYTLEEAAEEVKSLKRQDIRKVAQYLFEENKINLAVIGPVNDTKEDIAKQLHFS